MAKIGDYEAGGDTFTDIKLLELESDPMMLYGDGITTMQFYNGDGHKAAEFLKKRLLEVGEVNPWIGSKLVQDKKVHGKFVAMRCQKEFPVDKLFEVNTELKIHAKMEYSELGKAVTSSTAHIPTGYTIIKTGQPVCKLTVIPGEGSFVVIFSMSHVIADGYTYYAILNMFSETAELYPMIAVRDESLRSGLPKAVGEKEYKRMISPTFSAILNYIWAAMKAKKDPPTCYYLDEDKLKATKEELSKEDDPAPYTSTNDIITAGFARAVKAKMITMAMDFRGRLENLTKKHAGCYHLGVLFDQHSANANTIRKVLNGPYPYCRVKLPGACMSGNWTAIISNWSSMSKGDLIIPDCEQTLHLPYVKVEEAIIDMAVVFKARPGKIAVMYFLQNGTVEDLRRELPIGESVNPNMFAK